MRDAKQCGEHWGSIAPPEASYLSPLPPGDRETQTFPAHFSGFFSPGSRFSLTEVSLLPARGS